MIEFIKYHGNGNDFLIINGVTQEVLNLRKLAKSLCHRQFGFGADGLIIFGKSDQVKFKMEIINADGSIANMCGNGLRCLAAYIVDEGLTEEKSFYIETRSGIRHVNVTKERLVQIELKPAIFDVKDLNVRSDEKHIIDQPMLIHQQLIRFSVLKVDVLHCVVIVPSLSNFPVEAYGKHISELPLFPDRANVNFVEIVDNNLMKVRTYERGVGPTLACGTGVVASSVIAHKLKQMGNKIAVETLGGPLSVEITPDTLYLMGPVCRVGKGYFEWNLKESRGME